MYSTEHGTRQHTKEIYDFNFLTHTSVAFPLVTVKTTARK